MPYGSLVSQILATETWFLFQSPLIVTERIVVNTESALFGSLLDDFFSAYYKRRPVNATFVGMHEFDHLLPDFSAVSVGDTVYEMKELLQRLEEFPEDQLSNIELIDKKLAAGYLRTQIWEFESNHFYKGNPCFYTGEAVFSIISLFLTNYAPVLERVEAAIERMLAIPNFLQQGQVNISQAPQAWIEQSIEECIGAQYFFSQGIDEIIRENNISDPHFTNAANTALEGFVRYKHYLENELSLQANQNYSCGAEAFELMMRYGHFVDLNLDEYVRYAEGQIAEAKMQLDARAKDFSASSSQAALAQLGDIHPKTVQAYYQRFGELWQACRQVAQEKKLLTWPDFPIEYVPQPLWARKAAPYLYFLFYRSPARFQRPAVHMYLVPPIDEKMPLEQQEQLLRAVNESVIKSNHVIHHGSIGHHVQNWHAHRAPSRIGQMAATDCASRLAMFCAGTMAEGWAVYAGDLMSEVGFLTPLEKYAEYQSRRRMSARAVVDIKLHKGDFDLEQAVDYYQLQGGMNAAFARKEAIKNSMFPGAAMMYLFGSDRIKQFRKEMAATLKETFDLSEFHDTFLAYGSVPVELVCKDIKRRMTNA